MNTERAFVASRRVTRPVAVGGLAIGGGAPIVVQSMVNADPHDVQAVVAQSEELAAAGCELIRLAVPDQEAATALAVIKKSVSRPLVADVHFDYRLALSALAAGVDKLRINPGNIGGPDRVKAVVTEAARRGVPIRIGVNAGSLPKEVLERHNGPTAAAMTAAALEQVRLLEDLHFESIVISVKASDVRRTVEAYRSLADQCPYPLHLGLTEAGLPERGLVHSAVGLGLLLADGIGDTIRVSLTGDPTAEVAAGFEILRALGLREHGPTIIACPTCGRCRIDLPGLARQVSEIARQYKHPWVIAVMGCAVNGPGEARHADLGVAGGIDEGLIFRRGELICKVKAVDLPRVLTEQLAAMDREAENRGASSPKKT